MNTTIQKKLNDNPRLRWATLFIVALPMMMAYFITE